MDFLDRFGLEHSVVQAGMGGGVVRAELAGAVSRAGALGTIGILDPKAMRAELTRARELADGRPVAANLLVPFTTAAHVRACVEGGAALVVFHAGLGRRWFAALREAHMPIFCTVGSVDQARTALTAGADGLIAQGVEAGGHLMGAQPLDTLLADVRALRPSVPVLAAGGIAEYADVRRVLDAGADAAIAGTRFLLTEESHAHPAYKQRVADATRTLHTMLFGVGWPLAHRVVPNAATDRWCDPTGAVPIWLRFAERASGPMSRILPIRAGEILAARQRVTMPLFGPGLPLAGMPEASVERTALYAGETVRKISDVISVQEAVARLTRVAGPKLRG